MTTLVTGDITSPVNYQLIKYSHIRLEIAYPTTAGVYRKSFEYGDANMLVTQVNSKQPISVNGRLILVKSDDSSNPTGNVTKSPYVNGACSQIKNVKETKWIALVVKGVQCSIKDTLDNLFYRSNASAVIFFDSSLAKGGDKYEFHNKIGLILSEFLVPISLVQNDSVFINVTITVSNQFSDGLISRTSVLFVSISFILLMVISLVWLIFYYIQRFRYMHAKERLSRRLANAAKKALDKIPLKILSPSDHEVSNDYDQCAICIDSYNVGETIRILPCKHIFHKVCIDSWLIEQRSCPMCKVDILKACGVLNVPSSGKGRDQVVASFINQGLWVSGATVAATAPLLEAGLNGGHIPIESLESHTNGRCRGGHSTFLQRYRERYGLYHCHRGHRRDHFYRISRHFHEHHCANYKEKPLISKVDLHPTEQACNINQSEMEGIDLISESEHSIISQPDTSIQASIPEDKDVSYSPQITSKPQQELQDISNGLVYDICECSCETTNVECDVCDRNHNNSTQASTNCSCETCSDCLFTEAECGQYSNRRNNRRSAIGNLWSCCVASNPSNITPLQVHSNVGLYCCNPCARCRTSTCSSCNNKTTTACKNCSSKCGHTKLEKYNFPSNLKVSSQYSPADPSILSLRPSAQNRQGNPVNYESIKRLKSMMLIKNVNKSATIDSYTKSSISDDFDYEADNGSSSMEISVPAVKLTVLPPQVQCHQGPPNTDPSCATSADPSESVTVITVTGPPTPKTSDDPTSVPEIASASSDKDL